MTLLGQGVEQLQAFVVFAVLGLALAAVYMFGLGLFRARLAGIVFDCVFGAVALWLVFITNLNVNNGEFRLFMFLGLSLGAIISVLTCKTLLDKLSSALYNLFTVNRENEDDGTDILQQKNVDNVRGGDAGAADTVVYAVNGSDANGVNEAPRRIFGRAHRKRKKRRAGKAGFDRIHENGRLRHKMGGAKQQNKER